MRTTLILQVALSVLVLSACASKDARHRSAEDISRVQPDQAFKCTHDTAAQVPVDADVLYRYVTWPKCSDRPSFPDVLRFGRIAAANGHGKAINGLQHWLSHDHANLAKAKLEAVELARQQIRDGVSDGYYNLSRYLETGFGVEQDEELAVKYLRTAADMGNPNAQYEVAKLLASQNRSPRIVEQLRRCAAEQGQDDAAKELGVELRKQSRFSEAVEIFQQGVRSGSVMSAVYLDRGFSAREKTDEGYLALANDDERAKRYYALREFLWRYIDHNPKVPDLDQIVPLPPAKLPPWDGTFQWKREYDAAVPPPKPSEELIDRLSQAKNLDPATGFPLVNKDSKQ